MKTILAAAAAALLMGSGAALAQSAEFPWTEADFTAAYPDAAPELFVQLDANGDGLLDEAELDAGIAANLVPPQEAREG